jgi:hypothetical protein
VLREHIAVLEAAAERLDAETDLRAMQHAVGAANHADAAAASAASALHYAHYTQSQAVEMEAHHPGAVPVF